MPAVAGLEGIELVRARLALASPWVTSLGTIRERRVLLVRVVVGGVDGWGECVAQPEPTYTAEYEEGAWDVLRRHLVPRLLEPGAGRRTDGGEGSPGRRAATAVAAALGAVKGHPMAKAALEAAVLDAVLRIEGRSLAAELRTWSAHPGPARARVPAGVAVGVHRTLDGLLAEVGARVDEGYRRVKLKVHPGWDAAPVAAVRAQHPDLALQVDANGAYAGLGVAGAAQALAPLAGAGLVLVEQPLADQDLVGHARLARLLDTPLCLDEAIDSPESAESALALGACAVVNVKPGRVGGMGAAVAIHDRCAAAGVPVWCGGMLETGVGRAGNLALAALGNFRLTGDLAAAARYWDADIVDRPAVLDGDGHVAVPAAAGIGVAVAISPDAVEARLWMPAAGGGAGSGPTPTG